VPILGDPDRCVAPNGPVRHRCVHRIDGVISRRRLGLQRSGRQDESPDERFDSRRLSQPEFNQHSVASTNSAFTKP
jgi:hypothetical protein